MDQTPNESAVAQAPPTTHHPDCHKAFIRPVVPTAITNITEETKLTCAATDPNRGTNPPTKIQAAVTNKASSGVLPIEPPKRIAKAPTRFAASIALAFCP